MVFKEDGQMVLDGPNKMKAMSRKKKDKRRHKWKNGLKHFHLNQKRKMLIIKNLNKRLLNRNKLKRKIMKKHLILLEMMMMMIKKRKLK